MKKPNIIHHNPFGGSPSEWVSYADYELLRIQYEIALEDLRFAHRAAPVNELTTHDVLDYCANHRRTLTQPEGGRGASFAMTGGKDEL